MCCRLPSLPHCPVCCSPLHWGTHPSPLLKGWTHLLIFHPKRSRQHRHGSFCFLHFPREQEFIDHNPVHIETTLANSCLLPQTLCIPQFLSPHEDYIPCGLVNLSSFLQLSLHHSYPPCPPARTPTHLHHIIAASLSICLTAPNREACSFYNG